MVEGVKGIRGGSGRGVEGRGRGRGGREGEEEKGKRKRKRKRKTGRIDVKMQQCRGLYQYVDGGRCCGGHLGDEAIAMFDTEDTLTFHVLQCLDLWYRIRRQKRSTEKGVNINVIKA